MNRVKDSPVNCTSAGLDENEVVVESPVEQTGIVPSETTKDRKRECVSARAKGGLGQTVNHLLDAADYKLHEDVSVCWSYSIASLVCRIAGMFRDITRCHVPLIRFRSPDARPSGR